MGAHVGDRGQHEDVFHSLIEAHADAHTADAKSFTPLMIAARNGDIEMAKVLIAAGVNVNETGPDRTHMLSVFDQRRSGGLWMLPFSSKGPTRKGAWAACARCTPRSAASTDG